MVTDVLLTLFLYFDDISIYGHNYFTDIHENRLKPLV